MNTKSKCMAHGVVLLAAVVWLLGPGARYAMGGAAMMTDKTDYAPGETVILAGTGFQPGEDVDLSISIDCPELQLHIADYAWTQFGIDPAGSFVAEYVVPHEAWGMTLTANALGLASGLVATTKFTDKENLKPPVVECVNSTKTSITLRVTGAAPYGAPAGFSIQAVSGDYKCERSYGPAGGQSRFVLGAGQSVEVVIFDDTPEVGKDLACAGVLECNTEYTFRAKAHGNSLYNATKFEDATPVTCRTAVCDPNPPVCPDNQAPTITASNKDLGALVGCLVNGRLVKTVAVSLSDFSPVTNDPDGDPVAVSMDVSEVTLVGPGLAEATVMLTATDDPSSRNVAGCPALVPMSTTTTAKVMARIIYDFGSALGNDSFGPPLPNDNRSTNFKLGSSVPVKFRLYDCSGQEICTDLGAGAPVIQVFLTQAASPDGIPIAITDSGAANDNGIYFRYSGVCGVDGNWIFNLQTKVGYAVGSTYRIVATLNDGTTHQASISIKK